MISFEDYKAFAAKRKSDEDGDRVCYLGQTADEIKFHEGDIVEFEMLTPPDGEFPPTLGVVIAVPATLEQCWKVVKGFSEFEDVEGYAKLVLGVFDCYLVAAGRYQPNLRRYHTIRDNNISLPSRPVSDDERSKLMAWYDEAMEHRKNYILPGLEPEAEAYAARYKEIEPIAALEALAHMYVDQCGISRSARTVAFDAAEVWMGILSESDHPMSAQTMRPMFEDDESDTRTVMRSFVEFIPLINDELARHREMLERYDICYLRPEDTADVADMLYCEYDDDTTRIALCYGIMRALKEELHSNWKLQKFLGTL